MRAQAFVISVFFDISSKQGEIYGIIPVILEKSILQAVSFKSKVTGYLYSIFEI